MVIDYATLYIDFDTTGLGLQYPFTYILTDDNTEGIYSETIVDDPLCNPNCFNHVFNDIYAGQYTLTIFDSNYNQVDTTTNSCAASTQIAISEPTELQSSLLLFTDTLLCYGDSDGIIEISVSGGTGQYSFQWSNGATTQNINNLTAGFYEVIITDINNCSDTLSHTIEQPEIIEISLEDSFDTVLCFGDAEGSIDIEVEGGVGEYSYGVVKWCNNSRY